MYVMLSLLSLLSVIVTIITIYDDIVSIGIVCMCGSRRCYCNIAQVYIRLSVRMMYKHHRTCAMIW